jgi:hypothetical protein
MSSVDILLDSPYDEAFCLGQDIETLPRRDMTKLGDKGTNINSGLARYEFQNVEASVYERLIWG